MQSNTVMMMRSLTAITVLAFSIWTVTDAEKVSPCCVAVSRVMEDIAITGYRLQPRDLPCVRAVVFQTEKGQFCIDPSQRWVREKITEFRRSQINKMSPSPAPTTLTFSAPQNSTVSTQTEK